MEDLLAQVYPVPESRIRLAPVPGDVDPALAPCLPDATVVAEHPASALVGDPHLPFLALLGVGAAPAGRELVLAYLNGVPVLDHVRGKAVVLSDWSKPTQTGRFLVRRKLSDPTVSAMVPTEVPL